MLQSSEYTYGGKSGSPATNPNSLNPVKTVSAPIEQATIGRTLVIKGEISGAEALYIDGRIEGKISLPDNRVTIGRNGSVQANITAREVVVMGKVNGNIECGDRVDIRSEGSVTGDVPPYASAWKMAPCSRAASRCEAANINSRTRLTPRRKQRRLPRQKRRRLWLQPPTLKH